MTGIPEELITNGASEFMGRHTEFFKQAHRNCALMRGGERIKIMLQSMRLVCSPNDGNKGLP
jgi:hypothetical protein